jgi:Na+-driven multidrug efflux pump
MFPIIFFFISLVIGIGAGASVLIGQAWGAHEPRKVKAIAGTAIALGLGLGLLVAVFGGAFTEAMLRALGTPPDVLADATGYPRMMMLAMPGLLVFILLTQLMRGVGDTVTPLYAARLRRDGRLRRSEPGSELRSVSGALDCRHGIDPGCPGHRRGPGPCAGRRDPHRPEDESGADRGPGGDRVPVVALPDRTFVTSAPVIELAQTLLHIMLWSSVVFGFSSVLGGVMRASGSVLVPTGISIFCIALIEVPSAWLLSHRFGINGVWMAYPITFVSMLALQATYYQLVWRKKKIVRLV